MSESALHEVLLRLATDREFADALGDDPAALADRHGLTAAEAATVLATRIDTGARSPGRLEGRLSRSGLVFGADAMPVVDFHSDDLAAEPESEPAPGPEPAPAPEPVAEAAPPPAPELRPEPAPLAPEEPQTDTAEPAPDLHDALRGREPAAQEPAPSAPEEPQAETTEPAPDLHDALRGREPAAQELAPNAAVVSSETTQTENGTETHVKYADGSEDITVVNQDGQTTTHSVPSPSGSLSITTEPDGDTHYEVRNGGNEHVFADGDPGVQTVTNADGSTVTTINTLDRTRHVISADAGGATTYDHMVRDSGGPYGYGQPDHAVVYTKVSNYPDGHTETSTVTPAKPEVQDSWSGDLTHDYPRVEEIRFSYSDGTRDVIVRQHGAAGPDFMEPWDSVKASHTVQGPYGDVLTVTTDGPPSDHPPTVYTVEGHIFQIGDAGLRVTINDNGTENVYITLSDGSRHSVVVDEAGQSSYILDVPNGDGSYTQATRFPDGHIETKTLDPAGDRR